MKISRPMLRGLSALIGLIMTLPLAAQNAKSGDKAKQQRERAIERCKANRGTDCVTDAGLADWLLQERSRSEARAEGSRSIHQNAPKSTRQSK